MVRCSMSDARLLLVSTKPATQGMGVAPDGSCDLTVVVDDWQCPIASGLVYGDIMVNYGGDTATATVDAELVQLRDGRLVVRWTTTRDDPYGGDTDSHTAYAFVDVTRRAVLPDAAPPSLAGATSLSRVDWRSLPRRPNGAG